MSLDHPSLYALTPGGLFADRYRIVRPHRQGGLSTAFEVTDEAASDERCELQVFPTSLFDRSDQVDDFVSVLTPWMDVRSDAVLRMREILHLEEGTLAVITDFPGGEPLRARLESEERLRAERVVSLGLALLEGVAAIHAHGLVHGDIKPTTIHLVESGPLLVDGGVTPGLWSAKGIGERTALIGTPYYAPVEQFGGDRPDVRSDVYNVAAVLFECLTGVLPWPGVTFLEVFQAKLQKEPPSVASRAPDVAVAPDLEAVVQRGFMADRRQRFATATEFRDALAAFA